jgi:hypothetical protein
MSTGFHTLAPPRCLNSLKNNHANAYNVVTPIIPLFRKQITICHTMFSGTAVCRPSSRQRPVKWRFLSPGMNGNMEWHMAISRHKQTTNGAQYWETPIIFQLVKELLVLRGNRGLTTFSQEPTSGIRKNTDSLSPYSSKIHFNVYLPSMPFPKRLLSFIFSGLSSACLSHLSRAISTPRLPQSSIRPTYTHI